MNEIRELEIALNSIGKYLPKLKVIVEIDCNLEKTLIIKNADEHCDYIHIDGYGYVAFFNGITQDEIKQIEPIVNKWLRKNVNFLR